MNTLGQKIMMILSVTGIGAVLFLSSQYEAPRKDTSDQRGFAVLREEFVEDLYEAEGVEGKSLSPFEENPEPENDPADLTEQEKVQDLLNQKTTGLLWSNLERDGDLITLYLRGVLEYTNLGRSEQELLEELAGILIIQESQDLVVYRNGRPELFNVPNDQSGICLPEKEDLESLGNFTEETGVLIADIERFEIQRWFERGLVVRVVDTQGGVYQAEIEMTDRSPDTDEYSIDCSRASVGVFDVGVWAREKVLEKVL